ncbi:MAG: esterase [Alphaproteobacteria bacterium]|nr:esterase [Alphaproteobacteria bacterium]
MHRWIFTLMAALVSTSALAQSKEPIALRDVGSFHVGGRLIEVSGQPIKEVLFTPGGVPAKVDPNGKYQVEQMYAQYFLQQNPKGKLPLLMWHGGGLTGVTYETKPDGNPGWLNFFLRRGWDIYISDAMERGRAGWTDKFKGDPVFLPLGDPWERFRLGPLGSWNDDKAKRVTYPGVQFPTEAYEQFMKQGVPRWVTTDDQIIAAYIALVDKVCPCVVLVHSQAGSFGFKVAEARPDKIKALVLAEPSATGSKDKVAALKNIPMAIVYGDNAKDHPRWGKIRQNVVDYAGLIKAAGGSVDVIDLPDVGIKGNTHMMMMDKNSDQVAEVIQKWLATKGLVD